MRRQYWINAASGLLVAYGIAVMCGWLFKLPFWRMISPAGTLMVFQAALCFTLAGIGLVTPQISPKNSGTIRIAVGCALMAIAALMIAENFFSTSLGIDLTDLHRWYPDNNPHPGRMAPNTAISFLLAGMAFVLGVVSRRIGPLFHAIPAAITTLGVIGLAGYTRLFDLAYGWYDVSRMPFTAAVGLIILGAALMFDHRDAPRLIGHREAAQRSTAAEDARVYAFLGVAITTLAMAVFVSYGSIKALSERVAWVEHTGEIRAEFETLVALDARSYNAWRTFQITGSRDRYQEMFSAGGEMLNKLSQLQRMTKDNTAQWQKLDVMRNLADANVALLTTGNTNQVNSLRRISPETTAALISNRQQFETLTIAFRTEENRLLAERRKASQNSVTTTIFVILVGNTFGFAIMIYAAWLLKRQNDVRDKLTNTLESTNAFLDSLVEHIPNMIFVKDAEHLRFLRFNKAGEDLLGLPRTEMFGKNDYDFFPREEADFFVSKDRAVLAGNTVVDIPEETIHTRSNGVRILHTMKIPIVDENGQPKYLLGISEDITERKWAEQKIVALNEDLNTRATELEATNKELESFTYSVSHDLRAPLRAINGYALMLKEDYDSQLDDTGRRFIDQMRSYSIQMGELIDDLLRLSRLGRQTINKIDVDMNPLLQGVIQIELEALQGSAPKINITPLPTARADPLLLRQVWVNLISNALKYSSKNVAAAISISGCTEGREVVYCVKDNGVGFDMTYYDKLFNVFQRLHRPDEFHGTGVGLAIVHRVITRHGGRVWAEGKPNQGASFYFSLPIRDGFSTDIRV
jgi:PAS domain S-box-containing protein